MRTLTRELLDEALKNQKSILLQDFGLGSSSPQGKTLELTMCQFESAIGLTRLLADEEELLSHQITHINFSVNMLREIEGEEVYERLVNLRVLDLSVNHI